MTTAEPTGEYWLGYADALDHAAVEVENLFDRYTDAGARAALGLAMDLLRESAATVRSSHS